jgi:glycosyltransferase involved in cell wall biosynthesis
MPATYDTVQHQSILSDEFLRQLIAVGQVDVLVGLPTLDNAATILDVVRAIQSSFTHDLPRLRTVMINSDGGSTDGTPELIREAAFSESDMVQTSHSLRTLHRVVAPYHGLPGKLSALRTIFAAVELTQAKVLVVLDPNGPGTTPERVTELIMPIVQSDIEFLTPRYRRHPRDGVLVTQLVRPIVRALYGVGLDEPLGVEFSCSGRFASYCLDRDIWNHETGRFAIDLWLRTVAVANNVTVGQIWRPATSTTGVRATIRDAVQQVVLSLVESLRAHDSYWMTANGLRELRTWGHDLNVIPAPPVWDFAALAEQARHDVGEIRALLEGVLERATLARVVEDMSNPALRLDDELWVAIVYAFAAAARRGSTGVEHLAGMFVPLYLWRAAAFMARTAHEGDEAVQARLDSLCETFQRLKPLLVSSWSAEE